MKGFVYVNTRKTSILRRRRRVVGEEAKAVLPVTDARSDVDVGNFTESFLGRRSEHIDDESEGVESVCAKI